MSGSIGSAGFTFIGHKQTNTKTDRKSIWIDDWTILVKDNSKNISYFLRQIKITVHLKCIYLNISGFKS